MPEINCSEWNEYLTAQPAAHILQSGEWGELKSAFGWEAVRVVRNGLGAQILFRKLPFGLTFAYIPKGPVGTISTQDARLFWADVDALCQRKHAVFLKMEPDGWEGDSLPKMGYPTFLSSPQHIQPRSTLVVDLRGTEEDVFNRMKPKARYNIRLAGRKEVVVHSSSDVDDFYRIMGVTSQREEFHVHAREYYRRAYELFHSKGLCELFVASFQGQTLAAVMAFAYGKSAYYFYGASGDVERNRKPTYPLQWETIRWAHGKGCTEYDMWGIPDEAKDVDDDEAEAREDGLWGVYRFKRGFGGSIKRARPPMDRVYNPLLYKLYLWRLSGSGAD
ncbi:MAG TPA: peptidoglycan bridge formation glycyltransferase FemA/FemB family protein [Anaerolineales bacterium]|nr:peptidoglycan bridge formation glycyltransferase FemA/FemB family protein [Anaerolineales bacterium]